MLVGKFLTRLEMFWAVHHIRICFDATLLRVGEVSGRPQDEEPSLPGLVQNARRTSHLVPGNHLPLLRTY